MKTYDGMQTFRQEWLLANALGTGMFARVFDGSTDFAERMRRCRAIIVEQNIADKPIQRSTIRRAFEKTYGEPLDAGA